MTKPAVPIYINARNLISPLKVMVEYLASVPRALPIIVDNDSHYEPLLEWYEWDCPVRVIHTGINGGPQSWSRPGVMLDHAGLGLPFYIITDSDLDLSGVPLDVLTVLEESLDEWDDKQKAGLSLEINDIPDAHPFAEGVRQWESQFWSRPVVGGEAFFHADVDTTFAMRRSCDPPAIGTGRSLRTDRPYTARHLPWYLTKENITDEWKCYFKTATAGGLMWSARVRELGVFNE